jgi:ribosomal protein L40E
VWEASRETRDIVFFSESAVFFPGACWAEKVGSAKSLKTRMASMSRLERDRMVYCVKCGTKNEDDAKVCSKCGAGLYSAGERPEYYKRMENECFGIPRGGTFVGLAIGAIILLAGLILLLRQAGLISTAVDVWPFAIIIFGVLIVIGALYSMRRW